MYGKTQRSPNMLCGLAVDRCHTAATRILGVDLGAILAELGPDGGSPGGGAGG